MDDSCFLTKHWQLKHFIGPDGGQVVTGARAWGADRETLKHSSSGVVLHHITCLALLFGLFHGIEGGGISYRHGVTWVCVRRNSHSPVPNWVPVERFRGVARLVN